MIILDTDHFTVVRYADDSRYPLLRQRLVDSQDEEIATTVVTVEDVRETLRIPPRSGIESRELDLAPPDMEHKQSWRS